MRSKILLFFEYGTLNGGEFSLLAMLQALKHTDFAFVAALPSDGPLTARLTDLGIQTFPLILRNAQGQKRGLAEINAQLQEHIRNQAPDLVHANSLSMGRMLGRVAAQVPPPSTSHLRDIIKLNKTAIDDLNQNTGLVAVSEATKRYHVNQGLLAEKTQVIHNGVDTDRFQPMPKSGSLKASLGLNQTDILIVNIGQICLRKGQTLLAQAAATLAPTFPNTYYAFVGERYSQKQESIEYETSILKIYQEAGMKNRLFSLGFRQDIPDILNQADLLVHTAHQEPLGRVLLEASSCGQAIIATNVGGTPEILTDRNSALLIPPHDLKALCRAIEQMLTNPQLRTQLGKTARTTAMAKFSLSQAATNMQTFWNSFL